MADFEVHADSFVSWADLGAKRPYRANYTGVPTPIDDFDRMLASCPLDGVKIDIGLAGALRREDARKLYELAWHAQGDILELGTRRGLGALILATAIANSGRPRKLVTIDDSKAHVEAAREALQARDIAADIAFHLGDPVDICAALITRERKFDMAFVDHTVDYEPLTRTCRQLGALLAPGACVVFHDYNDARNTPATWVDPAATGYGVYNAVIATLPLDQFRFVGVYGCCGVFRRV